MTHTWPQDVPNSSKPNLRSRISPGGAPLSHATKGAVKMTSLAGGGEKMQLDPSKNAMQKMQKNAKNAKKMQKSATSKEIPL